MSETSLNSDYERVSHFLKQHGVVLQSPSPLTSSGYAADVSSQDSQHLGSHIIASTGHKQRTRFNSSMVGSLGSTIPRESTATVLTISPHDSPKEDGMMQITTNNCLVSMLFLNV
jgi:hypothetical protein